MFKPLIFFFPIFETGNHFLLFILPRCGHCKKLAPEWKKAANNLKGKVKLGHVNCDAEQVITRFTTLALVIPITFSYLL